MSEGQLSDLARRPETVGGVEILHKDALHLVRPGSRLERLATGAVWSEGPVWLPDRRQLVWSDIPSNRMLSWSPVVGMEVFRPDCEFTNGNTLDRSGAIISCSHGRRAIERTDADGQTRILVDSHRGRRLNSPNDVVVKSDGSIWFTDPPYGIVSDREGHRAASELDANYVFRFDPLTGDLSIVSGDIEEPNGLAFSPDESLLYVSDTSAALRKDGSGNHHIVAFDVFDGCRLGPPRLFAVIEPGLADGFRMDEQGWLFTSSADSIQVYRPDGMRMARIPVPETVSNCAFGGDEGDELFITATTSLYRIRLATRSGTRAHGRATA